ncbi:MAG: hypothetical protein AABX82_03080 [Nanoarchaeota archaeon]
METTEVKTDIHIIGLAGTSPTRPFGRVAFPLHQKLLRSKRNTSDIGNVIGYGTRDTNLETLQKALRLASNDGETIIPAEGKYERYGSLNELAEKVRSACKDGREQGRRTIVFMANNYALDWMKLDKNAVPTLDEKGKSRFQTTFYDGAADPKRRDSFSEKRFADVWKTEKEVYEALKRHESTYAAKLLASYVSIINMMSCDDRWKNSGKSTGAEEGSHEARRFNIMDVYIAAQQLAVAMKPAEEYIDAFIIISNPVDAFINFYQRMSGFAPEKLWCPLDNDRMRVQKAVKDKLIEHTRTENEIKEIIKKIHAVGPHNTWNMALYDQILGDLSPLFENDKSKAIRWMEETIFCTNSLAEYLLTETGDTPSDFVPVAHDSIIDAIQGGRRKRESTKVLQYSPDAGMHIALMGKISDYRVEQASWQEMLGETIEPVTREKLKHRDSALEELLAGMETEKLLPSGEEGQKERRAQFMREVEAKVHARLNNAGTVYTTRIAEDAKKKGKLAKGKYVVTTRYESENNGVNQLYFAFIREAKGEQWFGIEKLVRISYEQTPRAILFEGQKIYYGHSGGIAVVDVKTGDQGTVFNIKGDEKESKKKNRPTGVSSMTEYNNSILFTVPGKGIGDVQKRRREERNQQMSEAEETNIWIYPTTEFVDCITRYKDGYVAISGDGIVRRKNNLDTGWEKQVLQITEGSHVALEALAVEGENIFFVGHEDGKYVLGQYREGNNNNKLKKLAEIKKEKQKMDYAITSDYLKRPKIAVQNGYVLASLYDGTMLFYDSKTGKAEAKEHVSVQITTDNAPQNIQIKEIRALHATENGFIIAGNVTVLMQEHEKIIEMYGLYDPRTNPATCLKEIR